MHKPFTHDSIATAATPVAIHFIEAGAPLEPAVRLAALFAVFMQQNEHVFDALLDEGHAPEFVASEAVVAFEKFARLHF